MTTLVSTGGGSDGESGDILEESYNIHARFWESVFFPLDNPTNVRNSLCELNYSESESSRIQTPEIPTQSYINPELDTRSIENISYRVNFLDERLKGTVWRPFEGKLQMPANDFIARNDQVMHRLSYQAPQIPVQPSSPSYAKKWSKRAFCKPKLVIPSPGEWPNSSVTSPGTALLAMASNFLSTMAHLGKPQPSTPTPSQGGKDDVQIFHSEVSISIADEPVRASHGYVERHRGVSSDQSWDTAPATALIPEIGEISSSMEIEDGVAKMSPEHQQMIIQWS